MNNLMSPLRFIQHYPTSLQNQVQQLIEQGRLDHSLKARYPQWSHSVQTDAQLYDYTQQFRQRFMKNAPPLAKVQYDAKIQVIDNALGQHRQISRVHGQRLKSKNEIRVSSLLKTLPEPLLRMVVVHELAHFKEKDHNKAFYQLCQHMEPQYHQLEFDLRLCLVLHALTEETPDV